MNKQAMRAMLVVALIAVGWAGTAMSGPFDGWSKTMAITFSGYNRSETLTNFPALVVFSNNAPVGFSYTNFLSATNADLRFSADGVTELNYEIDTWNTGGVSYVWVQVPQLTNNATINAYWGNASTSAPAYTTNGATWSNGFLAVWHFRTTNGVPDLRDSSPNGNNGTNGPTTQASTSTGGYVGNGENFAATSSQYIALPYSSRFLPSDTNITLSAWMKTGTGNTASSRYFNLSRASALGSSSYIALIQNNGTGTALQRYQPGSSSVNVLATTASGTFTQGAWTHLAWSYDKSAGAVLCINGVNDVHLATSGGADVGAAESGKISGNVGSTGSYYDGALDEMRVSSVVRSTNWAWAEYMNMATNSAGLASGLFNTYGSVQANVGGGASPSWSGGGVANIGTNSATAYATLGGTNADVSLLWDTTDHYPSLTGWAGTNIVGAGMAMGVISNANTVMTNLQSGQSYVCRFYGSNSTSGVAWSTPIAFTTYSAPTVDNGGGATSIGTTYATLRGTLTAGGTAHVYILQGIADGVWSVTNDLGTLSQGPFSTNVTGLTQGTLYYYRCYATNSYGTGLASASTNFLTTAAAFASWGNKVKITFSGYTKSETLTNFPALVVLSTNVSGFTYGGFLSSTNGDLRFADSSEVTALNYEVDTWNTNGTSYVWVQVPTLASSNDYIWAYWGKAGTNAPAYTTNGAAWDSGYAAVWHLRNGTTLSSNDSTTNRNTGTTMSATATSGEIDGGGRFVRSSSQRITTAASPASLTIASNLTLEAWIKADSFSSAGAYDNTMIGCDDGSNNGYILRCGTTPGKLSFTIGASGSWPEAVESSGSLVTGRWQYVVGRYDKQTMKAFVDGQEKVSVGQTANIAGTVANGLSIGAGYYHSSAWDRYFDGAIDEVRISSWARSSNWIWATYMSMTTNSAGVASGLFNTYGTVQVMGPASPSWSGGSVSNIGTNVATAYATLGGTNADVTLVWDTTDHYPSLTGWAGTNVVGVGMATGLINNANTVMTNLQSGQSYVCRFYGSNATAGVGWSDPIAFTTYSAPAVNNGAGAAFIGLTSATLQGALTAGVLAHVWIYLGTTDGAWTQTNDLGIVSQGSFSTNVTGLSQGTRYYYQCYASNAYGTAWAGISTNFQTGLSPFPAWGRSLPITFSGYTRPETLTNFPALVVLSTNVVGFNYSDFRSGSNQDLRFSDATGSELNYEIETWNTNGASYVWVRVPALTGATVINAFWNKTGVSAPAYTTNGATWETNYMAVWHLNGVKDSTTNANLLTDSSTTNVPGAKIGNGRGFSGSAYMTAANSTSLQVTNFLTMEAWVYSTNWTLNSGAHNIVAKYAQDGYRWRIDTPTNTELWALAATDGSGNTYDLPAASFTFNLNSWYYVATTIDKTAMKAYLYVNGNQIGSPVTLTKSGTIYKNTNPLYLGSTGGGGEYWNGALDEVRISGGSAVRSTNWIWATYQSSASNSTFGVVSSVATVPSPQAQVTTQTPTNITTIGACLNGSLVSAGTSATAVWVFWGQTDQGATNTGWDGSYSWPAPQNAGSFSYPATLSPNLAYTYRFAASNAAGWTFDVPQSFLSSALTITDTADASEIGLTPGTFTVWRASSATGMAVTVNYAIAGSASNGVDYATLSGSVTIPIGATNAAIVVTPLFDRLLEGTETVQVTLASGLYPIGSPSNATMNLTDNPAVAGSGLNLIWDNTSSNWNWDQTSSNWHLSGSPNGSTYFLDGDSVTIGTPHGTINLNNQSRSVGGVVMGDDGADFTIGSAAGNGTLNLGVGGIVNNTQYRAPTFNCNLLLTTNATVAHTNANGAYKITFAGTVDTAGYTLTCLDGGQGGQTYNANVKAQLPFL